MNNLTFCDSGYLFSSAFFLSTVLRYLLSEAIAKHTKLYLNIIIYYFYFDFSKLVKLGHRFTQ